MSKKVIVETENAVLLEAEYADFDGTLEEWKDALYQVWRFQLTYDFAYHIGLLERRKSGVCMRLIVKPCYAEDAQQLLERLGCSKVTQDSCVVGSASAYDFGENAPELIEVEW